eukprot:Sspe_Gene.89622::Locus_61354_Transcript_2_2_Confidence_0.667_Length_1503::g.89622::m.89622/K03259/EIF4E; translation initiation factor 4E
MNTKLSSSAAPWSPSSCGAQSSVLSPHAPSWSPSYLHTPKATPQAKQEANGHRTPTATATPSERTNRFAFNPSESKDFTPKSVKPTPTTDSDVHTSSPADLFPCTPSGGPGRPSQLRCNAAPFTPGGSNAPSPVTPAPTSSAPPPAPVPAPTTTAAASTATKPLKSCLDPLAREFVPQTSTSSLSSSHSALHTPPRSPKKLASSSPPTSPSSQATSRPWRRVQSHDVLDGVEKKEETLGRRTFSHESFDTLHQSSTSRPLPPLSDPTPLSEEELKKAHPLASDWTLWFRNDAKAFKDGTATLDSDNWNANLKLIYKMSDVETFWGVFNNVNAPTSLEKGSSYFLFRNDTKPVWEDPANKNGGEWKVWLSNTVRRDVDTLWIIMALQCIGEQFKYSEEICGVAVETRQKNDRVSLWMRTTERAKALAVGREFKAMLSDYIVNNQPVLFTPHAKSLAGKDKEASYSL